MNFLNSNPGFAEYEADGVSSPPCCSFVKVDGKYWGNFQSRITHIQVEISVSCFPNVSQIHYVLNWENSSSTLRKVVSCTITRWQFRGAFTEM
jgi:hypothetical protein